MLRPGSVWRASYEVDISFVTLITVLKPRFLLRSFLTAAKV